MADIQEFRIAPRLLGSLVPAAVGYAASGLERRLHRGLPSPYLTFIFSFDGPVVTGETPEQALGPRAARYDVLIGGLADRPAYVVEPERQSGIQLAVHPLAARAVFGTPAAALDVLAVDGADVLGPEVDRLTDRLTATADWPNRFAAVQHFLRHRVEDNRTSGPRAELIEAWTWLARFRGTGSMDGLGRHVHLSPRQLRTLFQRELGMSPKQVARLMRFEYAKHQIATAAATERPLDLTAVAQAAGFYDHAHLDRDFRALTGLSPTAWVAEERRNIQAGGHGARTDSNP